MSSKTFLYIHGAMGSSHDLDYVKPAIEAAGHTVITIDLPGHGADNISCAGITLSSYIAAVEAALNKIPGKVILLAHSFGGVTATQVADRNADKLESLVYIVAFVPEHGESMMALTHHDPESSLGSILAMNPDTNEVTVKEGMELKAWDVLANDAPPEVKQMLASHPVKPEPMMPMGEPVQLTGAVAGVEKYYIYTALDKTITPAFQKWMTVRGNYTGTFELEAGHMPFVTRPAELGAILLQIGQQA